MPADYHVHTEFSDDSTCPMEDEVRAYKNYRVPGHMDLIKRCGEAGTYPFEKVRMRALGFHNFCTYEKMQPVFHRL